MPGINNIDKAQESSQTMKHTMSEILSLKTFSFKSRGLRVWKAYDVGPGKRCIYQSFFSLQIHMDVAKHLKRLERESAHNSTKRKWVEVPNIL